MKKAKQAKSKKGIPQRRSGRSPITINDLKKMEKRIMSAIETLREYVQQVDAETTRIAEFIENSLTKEGVTVEQLTAELTPVVDKLKKVGSTPPPVEG